MDASSISEYLFKYGKEQQLKFENSVKTELPELLRDSAIVGRALYNAVGDIHNKGLKSQFGIKPLILDCVKSSEGPHCDLAEILGDPVMLRMMLDTNVFIDHNYKQKHPTFHNSEIGVVIEKIRSLLECVRSLVSRFETFTNQQASYIDYCAPPFSFGGESESAIVSNAGAQCVNRSGSAQKLLVRADRLMEDLLDHHHTKERVTYNMVMWREQMKVRYRELMHSIVEIVVDIYNDINNCYITIVVNIEKLDMKDARERFLPRKRRACGTYMGDKKRRKVGAE